ncbi:MAG: transporter associated domain-containing protein, partial [Planctomycetota bacterium]
LDEYDDESAGPPEKVRRDGGLLELDASVRIDELNDAEGLELPEDGDFDTVGGFVYDQLGKVPSAGESFTFKNVAVEVLQADRRRVERVRIKVERNGEAVGA